MRLIDKGNSLTLFLLSLVTFQIGSLIRLQLNSQLIGNSFRIIGGIMVVISIFKQITDGNHQRLTLTMKFLLLWNTCNIAISFLATGIDITRMFGEDSYFFSYILPYLLLYDVWQIPIRRVFKFCFIFQILAAILMAFNASYFMNAGNASQIALLLSENDGIGSLAQLPVLWSIPAAIIFMNYDLVSRKVLVFSIVAFVFAIGFSMTFGRRSISAFGVIFLFAAIWFYIINSGKRLVHVLLFSIVGLGALSFAANNFAYLMERGLDDTRSAVEEAFFADMQIEDYIFGRGLNGTYYDPMGIFEHINFQRPGHETGYLNLILHSGCLFLIPYWIICFTSAYAGYFKSNNKLTKSFAMYIFLNSIMLFVGSYPTFALRFFLLWVGILMCNSKEFRKMSDEDVYDLYFS